MTASTAPARRGHRHRRRAAAALALVTALTLAACGGNGTSGSKEGSDAPRAGGTLVIAAGSDPGQFNDGISTSGATRLIAGNIFSGLTVIDEKLQAQPDLATSWDTPDDGLTWTFHLAKGVRWQDGQPFSSDDVKFTFDEILLKYHPTTRASLGPILDRIDTPDADTVVFHFKQPYGPLPLRLGNIDAPILPKHLYEGTDPMTNPANLKPVGTGPFKLAEYKQGSSITLVRNDTYFKPKLPYLDKVVFTIIPDKSQQVASLLKGEVDYVPVAAPALLDSLKTNKAVTLKATGANGNGALNCQNLLTLNLRNPHLAKVEVRQAMSYAVDRQRMVDQVQLDQGAVSKGPIASAFAWAQDPAAPTYPHDVAKANALLDQAGQTKGANGVRFTLKMMTSGDPSQAQIIKESLAEVGIDVDVQVLDLNAANDAVFVTHTADLGSWGSCNAADPAIGVPPLYVSSNIQDLVGANASGYSNPEVDKLFVEASSTTDQAKRATYYHQVSDILLRDVPYLWLTEQRNTSAYSSKAHDIANWSAGAVERAWISAG